MIMFVSFGVLLDVVRLLCHKTQPDNVIKPQYTLLIRKAKIDSAARPHLVLLNHRKMTKEQQATLKNKLAKPAVEISAILIV